MVGKFVKENKSLLSRNIKKANRVAKVLVKRRSELDEALKVAPLAYNNLGGAYNPQVGTFDTNAHLDSLPQMVLDDPALFLCTLTEQQDKSGDACKLFETVFPRTGPFGAGTGTRAKAAYDPTYAGLVEVAR